MNSISSNQPIHIEILGQSFTLKSDDSPEYIQEIVDELKQRYARISARMNVADPLRVAILAGLFLLDDFKKIQTSSLPRKSASPGLVPGKSKNEPVQSVSLDEEQIFARLDKRLGELGL